MTLPNVVSDLLMFAPSLSRWPVAPVEFALSDPAKSTKLTRGRSYMSKGKGISAMNRAKRKPHLIRDTFSVSMFVSTSCRFMVRRRVKTA
jgi:hypothetical protein